MNTKLARMMLGIACWQACSGAAMAAVAAESQEPNAQAQSATSVVQTQTQPQTETRTQPQTGTQIQSQTGTQIQSQQTRTQSQSTQPARAVPAPVKASTPAVDGNAVPIDEGGKKVLPAEREPSAAPSSMQPTLPPGTEVKQPGSVTENVSPIKSALPVVNPRFALTLAGGGARGAAHVGVLKVLEANGIRPDFVAGSSAGALVGALYCAGVPVSRIEQMFLDGEIKKAFVPVPVPLQATGYLPKYAVKRLLGMRPVVGLYSGKSIENFMNHALPKSMCNIEKLPRTFAAIAVNMLDTRTAWITEGSVAQAVRASSAAPVIYRPVEYQDKELVDGGVRANLPTTPAKAAGATVTVAVRLYSSLDAAPKMSFRTFRGFYDRIMSMLMAEIEAKGTTGADIVIDPALGNMAVYDFNPKAEAEAIHQGELAAQKMLPEIQKRLREATGVATSDEHKSADTRVSTPHDTPEAGRTGLGSQGQQYR